MNILLQAAGMSLKSGLSAYLALSMAAGPVQPAVTTAALKLADRPSQPENRLVISPERPTVQKALLKICEERGYGEECAKDLLGMLWKESLNVSNAVGDQGRARGYFQIWTHLHGITVSCAEDLECSANWTIDYLESNGYPHYRHYAVQCHNGCGIANGYAASTYRHGRRLWDQPLPLNEAPPQRVALK